MNNIDSKFDYQIHQLRETDDDNQAVGPKKIQRENFTVTVQSANHRVTVSVAGEGHPP